MKKIAPYILLLFFVFFSSLIWENIKLPFNIDKSISGQQYLINLHNPLNDSFRFIIFIFLPLTVFIITKIILEKKNINTFINSNFIKFKNKNVNLKNNSNLIFFSNLIIISLIIQFLCLDFKDYVYHVDTFHEGLWLTPSSNAIYTGDFWQSSYVARGLFGNFYNYFMWKITGLDTIGISRFVTLFFMFLNKILLILISKNLVEKTFLNNNKKIFLFISLSFLLLNLMTYDLGASTFYLRSFILLFFLYSLLKFFDHFKKISLSFISIGFLSSISFFWYADIGVYVNLVIFLLAIYFLFRREFINISYLILYILIGWSIFFTILPKDEFSAFYINTINIFSTLEYIAGLIYPTPFFSKDARSTRALLLILFTGVLVINLIFKKNNEVSFESKLSLLFLFLIACVSFKTALGRSDTGHIKAGLSFIYIPFFYLLLYSFINQFKILKFFEKNKMNNKYLQIIFLSFLIIGVLFYKDKNVSINNFLSSLQSFKYLVQQEDYKYLDKDYFELINFYKKISKNEKCVQIFTNESVIPYLLKKPTCSKYYLVYTAIPDDLQREFILDLASKKPGYILYDSDLDMYDDPKLRVTVVNSYILDNYKFHQKFKKWTFLKIK